MDFRFFDLYPKMPGFCRICRTFVVMPRKRLWLNQLQGQAMKQAIQARATLQATTPSENVSLTPHPLRIFEFGRLEKKSFPRNQSTYHGLDLGWLKLKRAFRSFTRILSDSNWEFAGGKHIAGFWALNKKARRAISRHFQEDIFGYMTMLWRLVDMKGISCLDLDTNTKYVLYRFIYDTQIHGYIYRSIDVVVHT